MKKSSSRPGTLTKLFGKKNNNNNSLYADNPPWILPKGTKKPSVDYHDDVLGSFSFLDDSGTATLKARPGPRVRPVLQFSNSNTEPQGLAVPTPSVPSGFKENASIGNGPKLNGNYRMYSSVGDLRFHNYEDDDDIPAPPSMPPPPPPSMPPPPPPPQESPYSSAISSPASPSPPDFIPPTPNSSVPIQSNIVTAANPFPLTAGEQPMMNNFSKWKSETVLNAEAKDMHVTLPNRFSFNPAASHHYGQTNFEVEPQSTLTKSIKVPPPAPTRISSMQEHLSTGYAKEPPRSPVPSSFNPSYQAKLHSASVQEQKSLNDTLNKRKSMLIMEDLKDLSLASGYMEDKAANVTDSMSSRPPSLNTTTALHHQVELNHEVKKKDPGINEMFQMQSNKIKNESLKPTVKVISLKPILGEMSSLNTNVQTKHDSLTRKEKDTFARELRIETEKKELELISGDFSQESPPSPPPMPPPPPPPVMPPPNPPTMALVTSTSPPVMPNITPPRTSTSMNPVAPPPAPQLSFIPKAPQPSPLLSPKPKNVPTAFAPPPPPPKAPPAAPPLPGSVPSTNSESQLPLLKALQEKQQTLKQVPKKSIDDIPAQKSSISNEDQKNRVGKIKGELEALFSPKKGDLQQGLETNKKNNNGNNPQSRGGENTLVNSLMLKVPLLPAKFEKDFDSDTTEWLPKSNETDIQIPEPDYLPISPKNKMDKPTYSHVQNQTENPTVETSLTVTIRDSPPKATSTADLLSNDIPAYKPHHDRKASAGTWTLDPLIVSKPDTDVNVKPNVLKTTEIEPSAQTMKSETSISRNEASIRHTGSMESTSPMALLMAAKKRSDKVNRSSALEIGNLPKAFVTSSLSSQEKSNTFVVIPKKDPGDHLDQTEIISSRFYQSNDPSSKTNLREEFQSPRSSILDVNSEKTYFEKSNLLHVGNTTGLQVSTEDKNDVYYKFKSPFRDAPTFNISSVPSPIPPPMTEEEFEYGIIPPPAEFTNSPAITSNNLPNMEQQANFYVQDRSSRFKSGLGNYEENNSFNQPLTYNMTSSSRDFSKYTSDHYTGMNRDSNKGSLIKKRLYMPEPEPESTRNYGKTIGSLRSTALPKSYMHNQSGPSMVSDPRRYNLTSKYVQQGRRMSAENRVAPPMTDLKYKPTNSDYLAGNPPNKPQSNYQYGMTFTVRPGTRQPISQTYQGGYL